MSHTKNNLCVFVQIVCYLFQVGQEGSFYFLFSVWDKIVRSKKKYLQVTHGVIGSIFY